MRNTTKRWGEMRRVGIHSGDHAHEVLVGYLELPRCENQVAIVKGMVSGKGLEVVERRKNGWAEVAVKLRWGHEEDFVALRALEPVLDRVDAALA